MDDDDDYGYTDDECDDLMDWVAGVYESGGNQPPTVDLTQIEVVVTSQGIVAIRASES